MTATRASATRGEVRPPDTTGVPRTAADAGNRPLQRWARRAIVGDLVAAGLAAATARLLRFGFDDADLATGGIAVSYVVVGLVATVLWPVLVAFSGGYDHRVALFGVEEVRRLGRAAVALLALVAVSHFLFRVDMSRGYLGLLLPAVVIYSFAWRMALRSRSRAEHRRGVGRHRAVAVGPAEDVARLLAQLHARPDSAIEVVAAVLDDPEDDPVARAALGNVRLLRSRDALAELPPGGVDLLMRAGRPAPDEMWTLARRAHEMGVALATAPSRTDAANVALSYVPLGATPLLLVETPALKPAHRAAKAVFDRVGAVLLVIALAPILAGLAVAILVRDGRPILYRQERVGRDGKLFRVIKFRTMVPDAERRLADLAHANEAAGPLFKVRDDPRITRTGAVLRRHSLDELPQLFNVLKGEMALVGPRPQLTTEVAQYDERTARRLNVRPGMTGLWQVEGRSDLPWDEGIYLDLLYIDHWSPLLDLVILMRTLRAVIKPRGAY